MSSLGSSGHIKITDTSSRSDFFLGRPENEKTFIATVPLGRGCSPQDVGNTCAYLCSDEAAFLTGVDVPIDGGRCV